MARRILFHIFDVAVIAGCLAVAIVDHSLPVAFFTGLLLGMGLMAFSRFGDRHARR